MPCSGVGSGAGSTVLKSAVPSPGRRCGLADGGGRDDPPTLRVTTSDEDQNGRAVGKTCHRRVGLTRPDRVPDQDRYVVGHFELVDLIEVDAAPAQRPVERPTVAVDDPLSVTRAHTHDVDELAV